MVIKSQDNIRNILKNVELPRMARVRQSFDDSCISDAGAVTAEKLSSSGLLGRILPDMRVALTGSSRQIADAVPILRETARCIKERGAEPVIIPAMGSHGGSTAEGQLAILTHYGITEQSCGCKIFSSMETVQIGTTDDGLPVFIDRFAAQADAIIPIGRIKAHTAFQARYESGLMKMLAIGLGKQKGADSLHEAGFGTFAVRIPAFANVVLANRFVPFGIGIIENAFDRTCRIEVLPGEDIPAREPALLNYAKSRMARLLLPKTDILVVQRIGKNISGSGMDPNISGTWSTPYGSGGIQKERVAVLDVTDESEGNALGMGRADAIPMRMFHKIDFSTLYPNMLTSRVISVGCIPMVLEDDLMVLQATVQLLTDKAARNDPRIVMIGDTLHIKEIMISEALLDEAAHTDGMEILELPRALRFDNDGNLCEPL